jgi:gluconate kinase
MIALPRAPRAFYLIGLAGVGKNHVGDLLGRLCGYHVYHADEDLPADMQQAVQRNELWTEEQVDGFHALIRQRTQELLQAHPKVVVTQATYFQKYRDLMRQEVPDIEILWVVADHEVNLRRIRERKDYVSAEYFEGTLHWFEKPPEATKRIANNSDDFEIIRQLIEHYG